MSRLRSVRLRADMNSIVHDKSRLLIGEYGVITRGGAEHGRCFAHEQGPGIRRAAGRGHADGRTERGCVVKAIAAAEMAEDADSPKVRAARNLCIERYSRLSSGLPSRHLLRGPRVRSRSRGHFRVIKQLVWITCWLVSCVVAGVPI